MDNLEAFPVVDGFVASGGTIDIGRIDTFDCAAIAADETTVWVLLMRHEGEGLLQLLDRLERRLSLCLMQGEPYDEFEQQLLRSAQTQARRPRQLKEPVPLRARLA
jgi:hypothetical protein